MKRRLNVKKIQSLRLVIITTLILSGCGHYKSSWDCKNAQGLGCTSVEYADEIARRHIILNEDKAEKEKRILLKEHYSDFKKYETQEVVID